MLLSAFSIDISSLGEEVDSSRKRFSSLFEDAFAAFRRAWRNSFALIRIRFKKYLRISAWLRCSVQVKARAIRTLIKDNRIRRKADSVFFLSIFACSKLNFFFRGALVSRFPFFP